MWKYAEVESISSKQKFIVETKHIKNFDKYSQATKSKLYSVEQSGKYVRCLILKTANSMEDIKNPCSRSRRPKPNLSSLEEKSDDSDESIDLTAVKRKRKAKGQNDAKSKKVTNEDILKTYAKLRNFKSDNFRQVIPETDDEVEDDGSSNDAVDEDESNNSGRKHDNDEVF
ncbi:GSCOCG00007979001-RA-CDS [Cotesia congregata]|nr:GSCOCG00007979001-RA-CDS [Cotesia congregata]